ncbi:MAG: PKD domain-containing protein, partial [Bacteroidota bacterium]
IYNPNNTTLNAVYSPTAAEISSGLLTLTLTTTGNGFCSPESDDVDITFTAAPTADAGMDQTVCANNCNVTLNGSVSIASGGMWSGGTGTYNPNNTTLGAVYTPSSAEITAGTVTLTLTTTGNGSCNSVSDQMIITITPAPTANAGTDLTSCVNSPEVTLNGSVTVATGGVWSGGTGTFSPSSANLGAVYTPSPAEIAAGSATLILTTTGNGTCTAVTDQVNITINPAPTANAGADQVKCANNAAVTLGGSVTGATGGTWTGGLGLYNPSSSSLTATYTPTVGEIASGTLTLTLTTTGNGFCDPVTDDMIVTFTTAPTANAGPDQVVCANNPDVILNGAVTIAGGGIWSGGFGTFTPNNTTLNATYTPTATEIAVGHVTLTLTTTGNGSCVAESDNMEIVITQAPIVNAGPDLNSCANNPTVTLNGNVLNATGGQWTGGTGVYNPSNNVLNATYTPSAAEISNGSVTLTLTSTGNGNCVPVADNVTINIGTAPVVNAGTDQSACGNNPNVVLNGSVTGASGGTWSNGLGVFNPNNSVLNATYTPTAGEVATGWVTLTLTSTGNGNCIAETDQMTITYTTSPTVNAGVDQTVCANNPATTLNGTINGIPTGAIWSGGLGSYAPNNTTLGAVYTPTAAEIASGGVTLSLTTTGNGNCNAETDSMHITITPAPTVLAGPDEVICVDDLTVQLNGYVGGVTTSGQWSTTGTGTFVPNTTTLNANYICSSGDSAIGGVTLILTSTANGNCLAVTDSMTISILPAGTASAGIDVTVCGNNASVPLNGAVGGGAATGQWSTSGNGVFVPTNTTLNATYIPSSADTAAGSVVLTLTANSCNTAQDNLTVTITTAPFVYAGMDQTVCVDDLDIQLDAMVGGATSTGIWSSSGTGSFDPDNTTIDAIYHASQLDSLNGAVTLVLTSTNNGNCAAEQDTMEISILPAGIVNAGSDQVLCSNNANVQLNGTISGGASQGIWSTSGSGTFDPNNTTLNAIYIPSAADTATGLVTLALTATNSCNFAMDIITINFTTAPTANAGPDQTVCANNPDVSLNGSYSVSGGAAWSTSGTGSFSPSNTAMNAVYTPGAADITAGTVDIYLTTTNNGGCSPVTDTMEVTITPAPFVNAGINQTVCSTSDSTQLTGIVSGGSTTGIWTTTGTGTFSPNDSSLQLFYLFSPADVTAGSVQITLTSTNNGSCVAGADVMTITFGSSTFADAGPDQYICSTGLDVILDGFVAGGTTTGIWTTTGTGTFAPADTSIDATYTCSAADSVNGSVQLILTTTNNGGCSAGFDTMEVFIEHPPVADAGPDQSVCLGTNTIVLSGSVLNATGGIWTTTGTGTFTPNDTTLNVAYSVTAADSMIGQLTFYLATTGSNMCNATSDQMNVTMTIPLTPGFTSSIACEDHSIDFFDNTVVSSGSITDWAWNFEGNVLHAEDTMYTFTTTGYHTVQLTVTSSLGCAYTIIDSVYVNPLPVVAFSTSTECFLDSIQFTDNSTVSGGTIVDWLWDFGDGNTSTQQNPQHSYLTGTDYDVALTVTSSEGCLSTDTISVTVYPLPSADFGYTFDCSIFEVTFADSSSSPGNALTFWSWTFGDGNTGNTQNPVNTYPDVGDYTVTLVTGSTPNCVDTFTTVITIYTIHAGFTFENRCVYDTIYFSDQSTTDGGIIDTWQWNFGDGTSSGSQNPWHLYTYDGSYPVSLSIQSVEGCRDSITYQAVSYPAPEAGYDITASNYFINSVITFTDISTGATDYAWDFGDGSGTSTNQNPTYSFAAEGTYDVMLITENEFYCVDTAIQNVIIVGTDEVYAPILPTGFTPNGDGENDTLYVRGGPFSAIEFRIYNEWGNLIFETDQLNTGWDGTKNGVPQPFGVYVYTVKATTITEREYKISGEISLIR